MVNGNKGQLRGVPEEGGRSECDTRIVEGTACKQETHDRFAQYHRADHQGGNQYHGGGESTPQGLPETGLIQAVSSIPGKDGQRCGGQGGHHEAEWQLHDGSCISHCGETASPGLGCQAGVQDDGRGGDDQTSGDWAIEAKDAPHGRVAQIKADPETDGTLGPHEQDLAGGADKHADHQA